MRTRILGAAAALAVLAGCAENSGEPISEDMFVSEPTGPANSTGLPVAAETTVTEIGPDGRPVDPALAMVEEDPYNQVVESAESGLTERLPDTCKLQDFQYLMGKSAADVAAAGLTRPYRVVGPSDIVTQEYNPMRVNFYTGGGGSIVRISCG